MCGWQMNIYGIQVIKCNQEHMTNVMCYWHKWELFFSNDNHIIQASVS